MGFSFSVWAVDSLLVLLALVLAPRVPSCSRLTLSPLSTRSRPTPDPEAEEHWIEINKPILVGVSGGGIVRRDSTQYETQTQEQKIHRPRGRRGRAPSSADISISLLCRGRVK